MISGMNYKERRVNSETCKELINRSRGDKGCWLWSWFSRRQSVLGEFQSLMVSLGNHFPLIGWQLGFQSLDCLLGPHTQSWRIDPPLKNRLLESFCCK